MSSSDAQQIEELKKEMQKMKAKNEKLEKEMQEVKAKDEELKKEMQEMKAKDEQLEKELRELMKDHQQPYPGMETYVLHVPDPSDKITMADSFHSCYQPGDKFGNKLMYFTSNAEEAIQEIRKYEDSDFDPSKSVITSNNADDAEECIRLFSEKRDWSIEYCSFVWALEKVPPPPSGKFAMIQLDLVSDKLYKDRVENLKPTIVYNVCASSEEADAWMNLTKKLGYKASFMDFSTQEKWKKYGNDRVIG